MWLFAVSWRGSCFSKIINEKHEVCVCKGSDNFTRVFLNVLLNVLQTGWFCIIQSAKYLATVHLGRSEQHKGSRGTNQTLVSLSIGWRYTIFQTIFIVYSFFWHGSWKSTSVNCDDAIHNLFYGDSVPKRQSQHQCCYGYIFTIVWHLIFLFHCKTTVI